MNREKRERREKDKGEHSCVVTEMVRGRKLHLAFNSPEFDALRGMR
jgi:hypothetical protein